MNVERFRYQSGEVRNLLMERYGSESGDRKM